MGLFKKRKSNKKSFKTRLVDEGLKMMGVSQLQVGLDASLGVIKDTVRYNLHDKKAVEEPFYMPVERYIRIQKEFKKILFLFLFFFVLDIMYLLVGLYHHEWKLSLMCVGFGVLILAFLFRYHFWLYQMKRKTLGCPFSEWYKDEVVSRWKKQKEA